MKEQYNNTKVVYQTNIPHKELQNGVYHSGVICVNSIWCLCNTRRIFRQSLVLFYSLYADDDLGRRIRGSRLEWRFPTIPRKALSAFVVCYNWRCYMERLAFAFMVDTKHSTKQLQFRCIYPILYCIEGHFGYRI